MNDKTYIEMCQVLAKESKCQSLKVGAIIVKGGRIISTGINGTLSGHVNCEDIEFKDSHTRKYKADATKLMVDMEHTKWSEMHEVHAEMNAILYAARKGISVEGSVMYVTHEPCDQCLKNILHCGIEKVVYMEKYNGNAKNMFNNEYRQTVSHNINLVHYGADKTLNVKYDKYLDKLFILEPKNEESRNVNYTKNIDQTKANISNKYIGFGVEGTSTFKYGVCAAKFGIPVNCGEYDSEDIVFASINGSENLDNNPGLYEITKKEVLTALCSGAKVVMDNTINRQDFYNTGERKLFDFLSKLDIDIEEFETLAIISLKPIRVMDIVKSTIVDGEGIRTSIYLAGCSHKCYKCHNPKSWNPENGKVTNIIQIINQLKEIGNKNITFSGGDPFYNRKSFNSLLTILREFFDSLNIWVYTGYVYDELQSSLDTDIINKIDVLVDGRYVDIVNCVGEIDYRFRGSKNQQIIDIKKTLSNNHLTLYTLM